MNAAKRVLCGVVVGLWAGVTFGAEPSGGELNYVQPNASGVSRWEARTSRKATTTSSLQRTAWDSGASSATVQQASVQTPAKSEPLVEPIKPTPDLSASGTSRTSPAPSPVPSASAAGRSNAAAKIPPMLGATPKIVPEADAYTDGAVSMGARGKKPGAQPYDGTLDLGPGEGMPCPTACVPRWPMPILSISGGVHGFKGPADQGRTGDFGFQEGVNWGASVLGSGVSYQCGITATQSNLSGDQTPGALHDGERDQIFLTAGLFHRAVCGGLQWGVVYDYLHDGYLENFELQQLRAEMSLVLNCGHEIGFWGAFSAGSDQFQSGEVEATDIYSVFYRKTAESGSQGRIWGGWTTQGGLVGADAHFPLSTSFALEGSFNYLIPEGGCLATSQKHETWSMAVNLVYYMGRNPGLHHSSVRPLMPLADNSYFLVNTRP